MSPTDARTLDPAAQEQLRLQAVRLREEGRSLSDVARICGVAPVIPPKKSGAGKWNFLNNA